MIILRLISMSNFIVQIPKVKNSQEKADKYQYYREKFRCKMSKARKWQKEKCKVTNWGICNKDLKNRWIHRSLICTTKFFLKIYQIFIAFAKVVLYCQQLLKLKVI